MSIVKTTILFFLILNSSINFAQREFESNQKNSEEPKNQTIEVIPFYALGLRKFVVTSEYQVFNNSSCGNCTERTYHEPRQTRFVNGAGLNVNYSKNRIYFNISGAVNFIKEDINQTYMRNNLHPHLPFGSITDYYNEVDQMSLTNRRLIFGFGFGYKIFRYDSKFNIIPRLGLSGSFSNRLTTSKNLFSKQRVYYWDENPDPSNNYDWDSTFYPSRITVRNKAYDVTFGLLFTLNPIKNLTINLNLSFGLFSQEIIDLPSEYIVDKLRFRNSFGFGYRIPFKNKSKIPDI